MPLQGNIRDFSTTQLLNLVNLSKRTGTLVIFESVPTGEKDAMQQPKMAPGAERARMAFHEGKLIYANLASQDGTLVGVLNRSGKLNNEQAKVIRERLGNTGDKSLAMRLIGAKYATQAEILQALKKNFEDIVTNVATWDEGPFRFDDGMKPEAETLLVPIDLQPLIIEIGRKITEAKELDKIVGDLDASLSFAENAKAKFKGIHLTVDEWKIVPYVDPKNTIRQIMKVVNMSELQIKRVIYGLNQAGLVEIIARSAKTELANASANKQPLTRRQQLMKKAAAPEKKVVLSLIEKLKSM